MTQRINKNLHLLKALHQCSNKETQKNILKTAKPELIHAICDCILNILKGNVSITKYQKKKLLLNKKVLRQLAQRKRNSTYRKKLLVQHGAGFLTSILGPVLKTLAGAILNI